MCMCVHGLWLRLWAGACLVYRLVMYGWVCVGIWWGAHIGRCVYVGE